MARVKIVTVSGRMEKIVLYSIKGKTYSRMYTKDVKQTEATKESAKIFARANKISATLRRGLDKVFMPKDKKVMYRVNSAVFKLLSDPVSGSQPFAIDPDAFEYLQFHEKSRIRQRIKIDFGINWDMAGKIVLTIPSFVPVENIKAPATTRMVYWTISMTGSTIDGRDQLVASHTFKLVIPYNETRVPEQQIEIPYVPESGSINIIALDMQCETTRYGHPVKVTNKVWLPSGVIGSYYRKE